MTASDLPDASVLRHVVDVHCHPTDAPFISPESIAQLQITVCAMSTMSSDQQRVRDLATSHPAKIIPCFGQFQVLPQHPTIICFRLPSLVLTPYIHSSRLIQRRPLSKSTPLRLTSDPRACRSVRKTSSFSTGSYISRYYSLGIAFQSRSIPSGNARRSRSGPGMPNPV